jgi:hypothetical protein
MGCASKFDLILFSWTKPLVPVRRVVETLKPGGIIVMECGDEFILERNALLQFDLLEIVRYESPSPRRIGQNHT